MRQREGIEPRYERLIVGADVVSNTEGYIRGAEGHGPREPTGVEDRGTSLGISFAIFDPCEVFNPMKMPRQSQFQ